MVQNNNNKKRVAIADFLIILIKVSTVFIICGIIVFGAYLLMRYVNGTSTTTETTDVYGVKIPAMDDTFNIAKDIDKNSQNINDMINELAKKLKK